MLFFFFCFFSSRSRLSIFFFFKQKTAYEIMPSLVGSEMCIRDRYIIDLKIKPYFEKKILSEITVADVRAWQNELLTYKDKNGKGYSPTYLKTVNCQLTAIFNYAMRYYNLQDNPVSYTHLRAHETRHDLVCRLLLEKKKKKKREKDHCTIKYNNKNK